MKMFEPFKLNDLELKNKLVMAPMCMYQVFNHDGKATHFHYDHYSSKALGGVGLIIVEATGVTNVGKISDADLGLYDDSQIDPVKRIIDNVHKYGAKIAVQLNHAGRKSTVVDNVEYIVAPSPIAYSDTYRVPKELEIKEIEQIIEDFKNAAIRADKAGYDAIEIHGAHGYLINEFISPFSNKRTDKYNAKDGLFLKEVVEAIASVFAKPIILRISATDYKDDGYTVSDLIELIKPIKHHLVAIHVSSGGIDEIPPEKIYPGYQIKFAVEMKKELNIPVIGVGILGDFELAHYLIEDEIIDLLGLARPLLANPNWLYGYAAQYKDKKQIEPSFVRGYR